MMRALGNQRGMTIPLVALMLIVLLIFAGLAIDLGVLYTARTSAQHAADAAALAGAFTFLNSAAVQPSDAINAATSVAGGNAILGQTVAITPGDVVVDTANRRVTVTVPRLGANGIPTYFMRAVGVQLVDVQARATAEASATGSASRCIKPLYIPNTVLSSLDPVQACAAGEVIFDSSGNLTPFAISQFGTQHAIKPDDPTNALLPSQFYVLDFGAGANTYRCTLGQCASECNVDQALIECNQEYPLKTGNMVGPTIQGVNDLIGNPADTFVDIGQYQSASGSISDVSRSLASAPVWQDCPNTISPGTNSQKVKVVGFVELFFDGMQGKNVQAHVVNAFACGAGGGGTPPSTGPFGVPVRLVQNPG